MEIDTGMVLVKVVHSSQFIDNLIPDMLTDLNPFEAFIGSFHCRSQAAG